VFFHRKEPSLLVFSFVFFFFFFFFFFYIFLFPLDPSLPFGVSPFSLRIFPSSLQIFSKFFFLSLTPPLNGLELPSLFLYLKRAPSLKLLSFLLPPASVSPCVLNFLSGPPRFSPFLGPPPPKPFLSIFFPHGISVFLPLAYITPLFES